MAAQPKPSYTPQEYLALERQAEYKSEYVDGEIYAMAGASKEHVRIELNLAGSLLPQLGDSPCQAFNSNMRVQIHNRRYYYPDFVVVCGQAVFEDVEVDTLVNPTVVFEILSPSTQNYDKGEKADFYRAIPSLSDLVLMAQDRPYVQHYHRLREQEWLLAEYTSLADVVNLTTIDCRVPLTDIYHQVLDASEARGR